jgi:hypothetical protein
MARPIYIEIMQCIEGERIEGETETQRHRETQRDTVCVCDLGPCVLRVTVKTIAMQSFEI